MRRRHFRLQPALFVLLTVGLPPGPGVGIPGAAGQPAPKTDRFGEPLPAGAVARLGAARFGYSHLSVMSPDGTLLATVAQGRLHLWDARTGRELPGSPKEADWGTADAVAISRDSRLLAVAHTSCTAFDIFELPGGKQLHRQRGAVRDLVSGRYGLAFAPDGKSVFVANQRHTEQWDMTTGEKVRQFSHQVPGVSGAFLSVVVLSPDGSRLATSTDVGELRIWDVAAGKMLHDLGKQKAAVRGGAFSPDGSLLVTGGESQFRIHDVATGRELRTFPVKSPVLPWFAFSSDGNTLAVTSGTENSAEDQRILLWNPAALEEKPRLLVPPLGIGYVQQVSRDGSTLMWRCDSGIMLLDAATGKDRHGWDGHCGRVISVAYSADGKRIATGGADGTVRVWDAATARPLRTLVGHRWQVVALAFSPDGKRLASSSLAVEAVLLWDLETGKKVAALDFPGVIKGAEQSVAFSPDGRVLFTGSRSGRSGLWDPATGKLLREFKADGHATHRAAFAPDGRHLVAGGPHNIGVYEMATGKVVHKFQVDGELIGLAFAPNGQTVAAFDGHAGAVLWDMLTGKERARLPVEKSFSDRGSLTFSPDGRLLAAADESYRDRHNPLHVWDLATGKKLGPFPGHVGGVNRAAFSPEGGRLATASSDGTVLIWDLARK
jgi:WD40 repeat protein